MLQRSPSTTPPTLTWVFYPLSLYDTSYQLLFRPLSQSSRTMLRSRWKRCRQELGERASLLRRRQRPEGWNDRRRRTTGKTAKTDGETVRMTFPRRSHTTGKPSLIHIVVTLSRWLAQKIQITIMYIIQLGWKLQFQHIEKKKHWKENGCRQGKVLEFCLDTDPRSRLKQLQAEMGRRRKPLTQENR